MTIRPVSSPISLAGAQNGMAFLWLAWITWPLMAAVQMMCARIGMVTARLRGGPFQLMAMVPPVERSRWPTLPLLQPTLTVCVS
jgi:hypothetical protein